MGEPSGQSSFREFWTIADRGRRFKNGTGRVEKLFELYPIITVGQTASKKAKRKGDGA